jgi:hypothetical protein
MRSTPPDKAYEREQIRRAIRNGPCFWNRHGWQYARPDRLLQQEDHIIALLLRLYDVWGSHQPPDPKGEEPQWLTCKDPYHIAVMYKAVEMDDPNVRALFTNKDLPALKSIAAALLKEDVFTNLRALEPDTWGEIVSHLFPHGLEHHYRSWQNLVRKAIANGEAPGKYSPSYEFTQWVLEQYRPDAERFARTVREWLLWQMHGQFLRKLEPDRREQTIADFVQRQPAYLRPWCGSSKPRYGGNKWNYIVLLYLLKEVGLDRNGVCWFMQGYKGKFGEGLVDYTEDMSNPDVVSGKYEKMFQSLFKYGFVRLCELSDKVGAALAGKVAGWPRFGELVRQLEPHLKAGQTKQASELFDKLLKALYGQSGNQPGHLSWDVRLQVIEEFLREEDQVRSHLLGGG